MVVETCHIIGGDKTSAERPGYLARPLFRGRR